MPMSQDLNARIIPVINDIAKHFGTPFHIYDEQGIRKTGNEMLNAFSRVKGFQEYYAVKALPTPHILEIINSMGFGFDCSSIPELVLSRRAGGYGENIMFTSNNTTREEFLAAASDGGSILNLDDITLVPKVPQMPELISFRYNPGPRRTGNSIIGNPIEAKYGVSYDQIIDAYKLALDCGAKRFGIHSMLASNELNYTYMVETTKMLLHLIEEINKSLGIKFEFINIGGGLGIPYQPEDKPLDIHAMAKGVSEHLNRFENKFKYAPDFLLESGRYMTGPHGVLVVKTINKKDIYRKYIGVDACMSSLMRPGIYGAYHHITVPGKEHLENNCIVDVVGSLCENNDKFAVQRPLPEIDEGDLLMIHDTGAHGHAMCFNYNAKLRPKELLLRVDGSVELIRREETVEDYFSTLDFEPEVMKPFER